MISLPLRSIQNVLGSVDQDVGDLLVVYQRLERPQAQQLIAHLVDQALTIGFGQKPILFFEDLDDGGGDFGRGPFRIEAPELYHVELFEQAVVNLEFELAQLVDRRVSGPARSAHAEREQRGLDGGVGNRVGDPIGQPRRVSLLVAGGLRGSLVISRCVLVHLPILPYPVGSRAQENNSQSCVTTSRKGRL